MSRWEASGDSDQNPEELFPGGTRASNSQSSPIYTHSWIGYMVYFDLEICSKLTMKIVFYIGCKQPIHTRWLPFLPHKKAVFIENRAWYFHHNCNFLVQFRFQLGLNIMVKCFSLKSMLNVEHECVFWQLRDDESRPVRFVLCELRSPASSATRSGYGLA